MFKVSTSARMEGTLPQMETMGMIKVWLLDVATRTTVRSRYVHDDAGNINSIAYSPGGLPLTELKVGTGTVTSILGLIATGDASIRTIANSAGISKIDYVDYKSTNILGLIATYTVYVYGE